MQLSKKKENLNNSTNEYEIGEKLGKALKQNIGQKSTVYF